MPNPNLRFKKHKTIRLPSGRISRKIIKKKTKKHICALCKSPLHGMPHGKRAFEVKRLAKTQRRPENLLASMLCPNCRKQVYLNAAMLKYKVINKSDLDLRYKKYVDIVIDKLE